MRRFLRSFLKFKWKLTASATLVTVFTAMTVMTVFMVLFSIRQQREFREDDELPQRLVLALRQRAPEFDHAARASPPDSAALDAWLDAASRNGSLHLAVDREQGCDDCGPKGVELVEFVVLGADGRVLAGLPASRFPPGTEPDPALGPVARSVVAGAASGALDPSLLAARDPRGDIVVAIPLIANRASARHPIVYARASTERLTGAALAGRILRQIPRAMLEVAPFALIIGVLVGFITSRGLTRRLRRVGRAAARWSQGDLSRRVRDRSGDELGELSRRLDEMADQLSTLMETRQELAGLEERNHLARELHDTVKQQVFSVSLLLGTVAAQLDGDPGSAREHLDQARELVQRAGRDLNHLILQLRPAALDGKGLAAALTSYCEDWSQQVGIRSEVRVQGDRPLPLELEQCLFRVAQEALANVARHSGAERADVHLEITARNGAVREPSVTLSVHDEGRGFDAATANGNGNGYGLTSMRERLEKIHGRLRIRSTPGGGTHVEARCPIAAAEPDPAGGAA